MIKTIILSTLALFFLFFVGINVYISQKLPKLFFDLTFRPNKQTATKFLEFIRFEPEFEEQKLFFESLYGSEITNTVTLSDQKKTQVVDELEKVLARNPQSRDALVHLAIFYMRTGRQEKAQALYLQAKAIDPWLDIAYLGK